MKSKKEKNAYMILGIITLGILVGYFSYGWIYGNQVSTDDAQLEAEVIPLAFKVGGTLLKVYVADNQEVKQGEVIAQVDPIDYEVRVHQLQAELEAAKAQAETLSLNSMSKKNAAQIEAAQAGLDKAQAEQQKAASDFIRAKNLKAQSAISEVEFENMKHLADKAKAAEEQAAAQLKMAQDAHGFAEAKVKSAEAALKQAQLQLEYTKIIAPRNGTLSKLAVQSGQIVQPGQLVAQLVDTAIFVVANFKETQIGRMKPSQKAEIVVDAYPGHRFYGKVESLSAATGARFSLIPPDNASGNFVKVVQRVPVKIKLDENANANVLLKAGLSSDVTVYFKE